MRAGAVAPAEVERYKAALAGGGLAGGLQYYRVLVDTMYRRPLPQR